jgi:hypothetical protein
LRIAGYTYLLINLPLDQDSWFEIQSSCGMVQQVAFFGPFWHGSHAVTSRFLLEGPDWPTLPP